MIRVDWKPDAADLRRFGLSLAGGALVAGTVSALWPGLLPPAPLLWGLAAVAGGVAVVVPVVLKPVHTALWGATYAVFWLLAAVVLALVYFGLVTPVGLLLRLAGRDLVGRRIEPDRDSYWSRTERPEVSDYFKQF